MISIIPIFLPQERCPYGCIFCNQRTAVGEIRQLTSGDIGDIINTALATISEGSNVQAGFYGGSFTHLPIGLQKEYLEAVSPFIKANRINGIRISTRPDLIDETTVSILKQYEVITVELGAQILDDEILNSLKRGHTSADVRNAVRILHKNGFTVGLQLMVGLPGEDKKRRDRSFNDVLSIRPDFLRIHPTLVLKGSELEEMYNNGSYFPLSIDDAVMICSDLVIKAESADIPVIRIGIQSSCSLQEEDSIVAGPWHPSFGQMVRSEIYFRMFLNGMQELKTGNSKMSVEVQCSDTETMKGQRNGNLKKITGAYPDIELIIRKNKMMSRNQILISGESIKDVTISINDLLDGEIAMK
jgi:histone acetyltransferase (RNA polymerase elongator complex component)